MSGLSEHAAAIKAAIKAAEADGFRLDIDIDRDHWDSADITGVDFDLIDDRRTPFQWENVWAWKQEGY